MPNFWINKELREIICRNTTESGALLHSNHSCYSHENAIQNKSWSHMFLQIKHYYIPVFHRQ